MTSASKKRWMEKHRKSGLGIRCNRKAKPEKSECGRHNCPKSRKTKNKNYSRKFNITIPSTPTTIYI